MPVILTALIIVVLKMLNYLQSKMKYTSSEADITQESTTSTTH